MENWRHLFNSTNMIINVHQHFMELALKEAKQAQLEDEVPIGAVVAAANSATVAGGMGKACCRAKAIKLSSVACELATTPAPLCSAKRMR